MAKITERFKAALARQKMMNGFGSFKRTVASFQAPSIGELQARSLKAQIDDRPLNYRCSAIDFELVSAIVSRAIEIGKNQKPVVFIDYRLGMMDLIVCHCNACPLKLNDFLRGETMDFVTDFGGIGMHLNRRTGGLAHGWWPTKFAQHPQGWRP